MRLPLIYVLLASVLQAPSGAPATPKPAAPGQTPVRQAVLETDRGVVVLQLLPELAPNHVAYFVKLATEGAYDGTIVHRVIKYGLIQGGDPLSKDPSKAALYGTGGLRVLKPEFSDEPFTAGAVGAVLVPGELASAGAQFFICATDQTALNGQYTLFARVVEGLEVVQQISAVEADPSTNAPAVRIAIRGITFRDPPPVPFAADGPAELSKYIAVLETAFGTIEMEMLADLAPETVRNFLTLARAGFYDGVLVHRVAPGFVIQTGSAAFREAPPTFAQQRLVKNLAPEFSDTPNVPGIVSMARGEDPASASTSFFICIGSCRGLDGQYTVFARIVTGMDVVNRIAGVELDGETPRTPIVLTRVTVR